MHEDDGEGRESVSVSMELTGEFDEVMGKLDADTSQGPDVGPLVGDVDRILTTIEGMDGGTRSAIAERLPDGMAVEYDAQAVVEVLQVLQRYGLVVLDGNTWYAVDRTGEGTTD